MGIYTRVLVILLFAHVFMQGLDLGSCKRNHSDANSCIDSEREALIKFKQTLVDQLNCLSSWVGDDCCRWKGISCDAKTGHVVKLDLRNSFSIDKAALGGEINPSLLNLMQLHYLDLSLNNFSGSLIPEFFGSFIYLRYLNLSDAGFGGQIPHQLGKISTLQYLDLRAHSHNSYLTADSLWWLSELSSLKYLDLSGSSLEFATDWLYAINMLPALRVLKLADCGLNSVPSLSRVNFTSLATLDLSHNFFNDSIPTFLCNLSNLVHMDLNYNSFHGLIPSEIGNLKQLTELKLSSNGFNIGGIPKSFRNLRMLRVLDLSHNSLKGQLPGFLGDFENLEYLDLGYNAFYGAMPGSLGRLTRLSVLDIAYNQLNGSIPFLGDLSRLEMLDLSNNVLSGVVSELNFVKLARLKDLRLSSNSWLILNVSSRWVPPFQLQIIEVGSCALGPRFPLWLHTQTDVHELNISSNNISGNIPNWFQISFHNCWYLDISNNQLGGKLLRFHDSAFLQESLLLHSNKFEGPLPPIPLNFYVFEANNNLLSGNISLMDDMNPNLGVLILSKNLLTGELPSSLCKLSHLEILDLSNNQLSGKLPWCLGNLTSLWLLDLTNNSLYGELPSSLGLLNELVSLHLHKNKFHGKLPSSFQNLTYLSTLDLGGNAFIDAIPPWIGEKLLNLQILSIQANNFSGDIPLQLCHLIMLRVLNMAHNAVSGKIPPCFSNFTAMLVNHYGSSISQSTSMNEEIGDRLLSYMKGSEREYTKTLKFLTSIDLSNNKIYGEIPSDITYLSGLASLDFSGNHITGRIPEKIGTMKLLESLDLSKNMLFGPVPRSLSELDSLGYLNLSYNNLSGPIPTGNHMDTLNDPSVYEGNVELCGAPVLKSCFEDGHRNTSDNEGEDQFDFVWFCSGMGPGYAVGLLVVCGTLYFKKSWSYACFQTVENSYNMLFVACAVLWRKFYRA